MGPSGRPLPTWFCLTTATLVLRPSWILTRSPGASAPCVSPNVTFHLVRGETFSMLTLTPVRGRALCHHPGETPLLRGAEHKFTSVNLLSCRRSFVLSGFHLFNASLPLSSFLPPFFPASASLSSVSLLLCSTPPPPAPAPTTLARSCKWLPANGSSEEKTDLNEEWRQKGEQRGCKRRRTQRDLEMHGVCVCVPECVLYSGQRSNSGG